MKRMTIIFLFSLSFVCIATYSQKPNYKEPNLYGISVNAGQGSFASAFSWEHRYLIGKKSRFSIGYGLRFTNFIGSDLIYATAPAKYTSGKSSIASLFSKSITANIDTVLFEKSQTNSLNGAVFLAYNLPYWKYKFELGVNIDLAGFTLGSRQKGIYKNNTVSAKPTPFNLLLIGDSDLGSLNSEWYLRYRATKQFAIKVGYSFLFTEYTTDEKIQRLPNSVEINDRFRSKSGMLLLGVLFAPFRK